MLVRHEHTVEMLFGISIQKTCTQMRVAQIRYIDCIDSVFDDSYADQLTLLHAEMRVK